MSAITEGLHMGARMKIFIDKRRRDGKWKVHYIFDNGVRLNKIETTAHLLEYIERVRVSSGCEPEVFPTFWERKTREVVP
jgi:hypothetical protein